MQEYEPDSSLSSSNARGKGKNKEKDYGKPGKAEYKNTQTARTDREHNALDLLNEMEELRKDVSQLTKMVAEIGPLPTRSYQAHGRRGVSSARKMLNEMEELRKDVSQLAKTFAEGREEVGQIAKVAEFGPLLTGRDQAHGRSDKDWALKTSKSETREPSPSGGSGRGEAPKHGNHYGDHQADHYAYDWGHAPRDRLYHQGHGGW